ncbi:MAG: transposase [Candidatus Thioglobus sp.]|uniref:transposase n=1 Tax=Candidatus Thioglobus sp. TaxID=2026721 RepID=UPI00260D286E|nr:transposase [Candidatus Thioglobus sp.]MDC9727119.1 transposase [Candidatus Thioglobus sp.]
MPRQARNVFSNIPHHVTQRGNRQADVFFSDEDKEYYLKLLLQYSVAHDVKVLAYCLMTNHIHLILLPATEDGLQKVLKPLHMRYAQYINKKNSWNGHLWQGRYFSSALDERYTYHTFRYVENNPVRAKMVKQAIDYKYSSAAHHCGLVYDDMITAYDIGVEQSTYLDYLQECVDDDSVNIIRRNVNKGLPCGGKNFIDKLSKSIGRDLSFKQIGRPKKGTVPS